MNPEFLSSHRRGYRHRLWRWAKLIFVFAARFEPAPPPRRGAANGQSSISSDYHNKFIIFASWERNTCMMEKASIVENQADEETPDQARPKCERDRVEESSKSSIEPRSHPIKRHDVIPRNNYSAYRYKYQSSYVGMLCSLVSHPQKSTGRKSQTDKGTTTILPTTTKS